MHTETITIYSYSELSEEAKATAYKAWEPDYAFEADNAARWRRSVLPSESR